jgi:hypothetical protein
MDAVLKVGGSLADHPASLRKLCKELASLAENYRLLIVPGGGKFADNVREFDKAYMLSNTVSHRMAVLAMDQYGLLLSDITPNSYVVDSLEQTKKTPRKRLPILLPSRHILSEEPLEHSWDITSDSIAAYIAGVIHAKKLVLITDVDGIFSKDPKKNKNAKFIPKIHAKTLLKWNKRTSVDKTLPKILLETKLNSFVVNGRYPQRVKAILNGKESVYTHITG